MRMRRLDIVIYAVNYVFFLMYVLPICIFNFGFLVLLSSKLFKLYADQPTYSFLVMEKFLKFEFFLSW